MGSRADIKCSMNIRFTPEKRTLPDTVEMSAYAKGKFGAFE